MSVDNQIGDSEFSGMQEIKQQPSNAEEIAYQQKCLQSLADLKTRKKNDVVITCGKCCMKWFYTIKECPLCRCKDPRDIKKVSSSVDFKALEDIFPPKKKLDRPAKITMQCTVCSDDTVEELDDEFENFLRNCGHVRCERCSEISVREIHNCLFCGEKISLVKFSKSLKDEDGFPEVEYKFGPLKMNCIECLRRWKPEDSKCKFCEKSSAPCEEKDKHDSNVDNTSENREVQNPVGGESPVNTTAVQASIFNTFFNSIFSFFGIFRNERPTEQAPISNIDELEASNVTASETYIE